MRDEVAADPVASAVLGGLNMRNALSAELSAMPVDPNCVAFDMSHIYASGNIAADMTANIAAESTCRVLATRVFNPTSDPA
jgi:Mn-containing catalase